MAKLQKEYPIPDEFRSTVKAAVREVESARFAVITANQDHYDAHKALFNLIDAIFPELKDMKKKTLGHDSLILWVESDEPEEANDATQT